MKLALSILILGSLMVALLGAWFCARSRAIHANTHSFIQHLKNAQNADTYEREVLRLADPLRSIDQSFAFLALVGGVGFLVASIAMALEIITSAQRRNSNNADREWLSEGKGKAAK